jgi:recombination protein RecT
MAAAPNQQLERVKTNKDLSALLTQRSQSIADVLPKHMKVDRLIKLALLAATKTPDLLMCTQASVMQSLMTCAQLGLEPNGMLGSGYLVPYGNKCEFIPGYRGLIDLARRSGEVVKVEARVVYSGDIFEVDYGTEAKITHKPNLSGKRTQKDIVAFYMVAQLNQNDRQFEVMTKDEVDAIRARSKASGKGPWVTDYEEMGKKTVVKRGMKYLPLSPQLAAAIEHDNRIESGEIGGVSDLIDDANSLQQRMAENTAAKQAELRDKLSAQHASQDSIEAEFETVEEEEPQPIDTEQHIEPPAKETKAPETKWNCDKKRQFKVLELWGKLRGQDVEESELRELLGHVRMRVAH